MSRQRFIHPDIWTDKKTSKMGIMERLLFIGLFSNADDEGRIMADPAYLRSLIFPYDDFTIEQVKQSRDKVLAADGNVVLYVIGDDEYIYFAKWQVYQKPKYPKPSKIPVPPIEIPENVSGKDSPILEKDLPHGLGLGRDGVGMDRVGTDIPETLPQIDKTKEKGKQAKQLLDYFFAKFQDKSGEKMAISGGKEMGLLIKLLGTFDFEKLKGLIDDFFNSEDDFILNAGFTIGVFNSNINKLLTKRGVKNGTIKHYFDQSKVPKGNRDYQPGGIQ